MSGLASLSVAEDSSIGVTDAPDAPDEAGDAAAAAPPEVAWRVLGTLTNMGARFEEDDWTGMESTAVPLTDRSQGPPEDDGGAAALLLLPCALPPPLPRLCWRSGRSDCACCCAAMAPDPAPDATSAAVRRELARARMGSPGCGLDVSGREGPAGLSDGEEVEVVAVTGDRVAAAAAAAAAAAVAAAAAATWMRALFPKLCDRRRAPLLLTVRGALVLKNGSCTCCCCCCCDACASAAAEEWPDACSDSGAASPVDTSTMTGALDSGTEAVSGSSEAQESAT